MKLYPFIFLIFLFSCTVDEKDLLCPVQVDKIIKVTSGDRLLEFISSDSLIKSIDSGEVIEIMMLQMTESGISRQVTIQRDSVTYISYLDLMKVSVKSGQKINAGDIIGVARKEESQFTMGLRVWKSDKPGAESELVNPEPYCTCK